MTAAVGLGDRFAHLGLCPLDELAHAGTHLIDVLPEPVRAIPAEGDTLGEEPMMSEAGRKVAGAAPALLRP